MEKENEIPEEKEIEVQEQENLKQEEIKKESQIQEKDKEIEKVESEVEEKTEEPQKEVEREIKKESKEDIKQTNKNNKKWFIIIPIITVILLFLSTFFAIINMNNANVAKGVYIEGIEVSNLSLEQVNNLINEKIKSIENVDVYYGEYNDVIKLEDLGIKLSAKDAINKAVNIGKSNNILIDNFSILKSMLFKTNIEIDIEIDKEKFSEMTKNIQAEIPEKIEQYSYEIKDDELIITNGKSGRAVIQDKLENIVVENIKKQFNGIKETIEIPVKFEDPEKINIEKIYEEIYKEARDAYIIEDKEKDIFELHKEENGVDFKITVEEAKQIIIKEKEIYTIPLKITKPKVAVKDLGDKLFKKTLSKYTTIYDAGNYNRSHNVALAAKTLNGTILLPGETFSYNGKLGNTNAAKGYKQATAYVGGKVVPSYGGGICQVSSTLYNAVLYANLEIVERYNHSYAVSYVPAGRDATVAYGGKDFKFKNNRTYPIKIVASAKNGIVSISIAGIEEEMDKYEIVLTSTVLSTKANQTVYEKNSSLEEGKEKVIQSGYTGKTSIAYKIVKNPDGSIKSKTVLSKDTYKPMNRIVEVGTKKVAPTTPTVTQPVAPSVPTTTPTDTTVVTNNVIL